MIISNDLASGDSPQYTIGDTAIQLVAAFTAGAVAASACSESGPGAIVCGLLAFAFTYVASSGAGLLYKYTFHGN